MPAHDLKIEIFSAPNCKQCDKAFQLVERVLRDIKTNNTHLAFQRRPKSRGFNNILDSGPCAPEGMRRNDGKIYRDSSGNTCIDLRKLSVLDELDYAVDIGVRATPSIAMNGELVFTAMPSAEALRKAILSHIGAEKIRKNHE